MPRSSEQDHVTKDTRRRYVINRAVTLNQLD